MKEKLLIVFLLVITLISISFFQQKNKKINYMVIGNRHEFVYNLKSLNYIDLIKNDLEKRDILNSYSKDFIYNDIRTKDLINKIKFNEKKNNKTFQNSLNKSDILIINLGSDELDYQLYLYEKYKNDNIYNYLNKEYKDINKLIKIIRKYTNAKIIFIGLYNHSKQNISYYKFINNKIKHNKNIIFIDMYDVINTENNKYYLDYTENMSIYRKIISEMSCKNII